MVAAMREEEREDGKGILGIQFCAAFLTKSQMGEREGPSNTLPRLLIPDAGMQEQDKGKGGIVRTHAQRGEGGSISEIEPAIFREENIAHRRKERGGNQRKSSY